MRLLSCGLIYRCEIISKEILATESFDGGGKFPHADFACVYVGNENSPPSPTEGMLGLKVTSVCELCFIYIDTLLTVEPILSL